MRNDVETHGALTEPSLNPPTRKGREGKGREIGGEDALLHASYLTEGAVDNPLASAIAATRLRAGCNAFGEIRRWVR